MVLENKFWMLLRSFNADKYIVLLKLVPQNK